MITFYLSDGRKLPAADSLGNGLWYIGSLVYSQRGSVVRLESIGFHGGRFIASTAGFEPQYHFTDHLGSVRAVVDAAGPLSAPTTNQRLFRIHPENRLEDITEQFRRKP